jgi:hypothetical protein
MTARTSNRKYKCGVLRFGSASRQERETANTNAGFFASAQDDGNNEQRQIQMRGFLASAQDYGENEQRQMQMRGSSLRSE